MDTVGGTDKLFDSSGRPTNDSTREFVQNFMRAFADWVAANAKG